MSNAWHADCSYHAVCRPLAQRQGDGSWKSALVRAISIRDWSKSWKSCVPEWVILSLVGVAAVYEIRGAVPFVVDDSYITFAFSKSLATGRGPIYGHDMVVEGYSNFLWMIIIAILLRIAPGADPLWLARGAMVPFFGLMLVATFKLARAGSTLLCAAAAVLLLVLDQDVIFGFLSGLETIPFTALVTAGLLLYVHSLKSERLRPFVTPILGGAALMRIDGFLPLGFIIVFDALKARSERSFSLAGWARWAAPGLLVWASWFGWRYWYYGLPLPSTYYAKALIPKLLPQRGRDYVVNEMFASGLWVAFPAMGILLWGRRREALPLILYASGHLAYAACVGGDWMPYGRFVLPAVPLLVVLVIWAGNEVGRMVPLRGFASQAAASISAIVPLTWIAFRVEPHVTRETNFKDKQTAAAAQVTHVTKLKEAARYLNAAIPVGGRLVTDYGGVFAYYTQATPIEMWGLCNATIARRGTSVGVEPIYGKTCPECYAKLNPEYFHTFMPVVRGPTEFLKHADVVRAVWQSDTIGRYVDMMRGFVTGRVRDARFETAAWFLEKRSRGWRPHPRVTPGGFLVEYPFEQGGLLNSN